jgi:hypothetical protein
MVRVNSITTRISTVFLREDGVLQINIKPDNEFSVFDFNELVGAAKEIGNGQKFLNLIIVGNNTLPDNDARIGSCSKAGSVYKNADAFVIKSLAQTLVANFYMKFNKPFVPTKFFNNEEDALIWLKQQCDNI